MTTWHRHDYADHPAGVTHRWCVEWWPDDDAVVRLSAAGLARAEGTS